jgi:biopolymer transport protein ExbB/TolQ
MDAYSILVIIISILMIVMLILSIILLASAIKIMKNLKKMSDTANQTVEVVKSAAVNLKNAAGPIATGKFVMDMISKLSDAKKSKSSKK